MSNPRMNAAVERALAESGEETEYATPYGLVSQSLRQQPAKTKAEVVDLLVREFALHEFDAQTVARSAADLAQLRDAVRLVRKRRYGQLEISYIEFDVVTWRILPSVENVRFEGPRSWKPSSAARYSSLGGSQPVLTLATDHPAELLHELDVQTTQIWRSNVHSRSIPMRGIENSGLLSIARIKLGDSGYVGVLDATDGFSRTVGAQRGSGVDVSDVLGELQNDGPENKLRTELIALRDDGDAELDSQDGKIAASRLRCSVMPRAQVIVGYKWLDQIGDSQKDEGFAGARRQLVGHIHLEPPLKFTDSTQFALKARIALNSLKENSLLPAVDGYSPDNVLNLLLTGNAGERQSTEVALRPDEVLLLAVDAIRGPSGNYAASIAVNRAIYSLTGKRPLRQERAVIAVDTAMRANRLAMGVEEPETDFAGKRSTMGRAVAHSAFNSSKLTRRPIAELLASAVDEIRKSEEIAGVTRELKVSVAAAELGALGVYALVEGVDEPLIERSGSKAADGSYLPEPPEVMMRMMTSTAGLNQLAQAVFDSRSRRRMTLVPEGQSADDAIHDDWDTLTSQHLIAFARGGIWNTDGGDLDPRSRLDFMLSGIRNKVKELQALVTDSATISNSSGAIIIDNEGAPMTPEYNALIDLSFILRNWTETSAQSVVAAEAAHEGDTEFANYDWQTEEGDEDELSA